MSAAIQEDPHRKENPLARKKTFCAGAEEDSSEQRLHVQIG
jgi:hypothetical protein